MCKRKILQLFKKRVGWMEKKKVYKQQLVKTQEQKELFEKNQPAQNKPMSQPTDLQKKYVYDVYDKIAQHFSHTRYKAWPKVQKFLNSLDPGSLVLDVGCGNGKYIGVNSKNLLTIGTDRSKGLLDTAIQKDKNFQLFAADSLRLPVRTGIFDCFISIAVIHHFSSDPLRHQAISELMRILRPYGKGLIYVWAMEQEERKFVQQDVFVPWNLAFKYEEKEALEKKKKGEITDQKVDEQKHTVVYKRYYHVFKQGQLEKLLVQHKDIKILDSFYDHANWCAIVQKIPE